MGVSKFPDITNLSELKLSHQLGIPEKAGSAGLADSLEKTGSKSFADSLKAEYGKSGIQLSKHARQRMLSRGMEVTPGLLSNLDAAVQKARDKGSKDVVVIGDRSAFIVNVPNNTVITMMTEREMKENIFTNIDSAVIL